MGSVLESFPGESQRYPTCGGYCSPCDRPVLFDNKTYYSFSGKDSSPFNANDGYGRSNATTMPIKVNARPMVHYQGVTLNKGKPVSITFTGPDPEGDSLVDIIVSNPSTGGFGVV